MCACCHDVHVGKEPLYALAYVINVRTEKPVGNGAILEVDKKKEKNQHCAHGRDYRNIPFVEVIMVEPSAPTYRNAAHDRSSIHIVGGAVAQSAGEKINNSDVSPRCD